MNDSELAACPSLTPGTYAFDLGDTAHLALLAKVHTLGSTDRSLPAVSFRL